MQLSADNELDAQADADSRTPAISGNGAVVAFAAPATTLARVATGGITQVFAHTWVGTACITVLASAADTAASQPPPTDTDDDENRCEDRSTQRLLNLAETVHEVMDKREQRQRTTAVVRARDHSGECVYVVAGGATHDLKRKQQDVLGDDEIAADRRPFKHADLTALHHIKMRRWRPLALGIAPPERTICPGCRRHIENRAPYGEVISPREAVWP